MSARTSRTSAQAAPRRRLRFGRGAAGYYLHRRDRQDRQDQPKRLDHARRLRAKGCSRPSSRCSKGPWPTFRRRVVEHPEQQYIQMDTTDILFICGGTFVGLENIVGKRLGKRTIGFGQEASQQAEIELGELLAQVTRTNPSVRHDSRADRPASRGHRTPAVGCGFALPRAPRAEERLVQAIPGTFHMENAKLEFTEEGVRAIAEKAHAKDVGARAYAIVEEIMLDIMYELPDRQAGSRTS